jgi:hypothetical protein
MVDDSFDIKLDDADYHVSDALEAGYPEEHAWTHMAVYLAWLTRHGLVDGDWFDPSALAAVQAGESFGTDLI